MLNVQLRPVVAGDVSLLFQWVNSPSVTVHARNRGTVSWEDHVRWFEKAIADPSRVMRVAEVGKVPVGLIRSGPNQEGDVEVCFSVGGLVENPADVGAAMVGEFLSKCVSLDGMVVLPIRDGNIVGEGVARRLGLSILNGHVDRGQGVNYWTEPQTGDA